MATEPASEVAEAQLSEFGDALWRAMFSVGFTAFIAAFVFLPTLNALGVLSLIRTHLTTDLVGPYLVSSWMGLSIYLSYEHIQSDETSTDGESDTTDSEGLLGKLRDLIENWAVISFMFIIVGLGAVSAMAVATYVSPVLAPAVALVYPIADWAISMRIDYPVTPSAVLLLLAYLVIIPLSILVAVVAASVGFVFGLLYGLMSGLLTPVKMVLDWLRRAGVDEATQGPLRGARRRMGF